MLVHAHAEERENPRSCRKPLVERRVGLDTLLDFFGEGLGLLYD